MLRFILMILALLCFAISAVEIKAPRIDLVALGLALVALVILLGLPPV